MKQIFSKLSAATSAGYRVVSRAFASVALLLIAFYQKAISPFLPPSCRFYPTCSQYADEAIRKHGFWRGAGLAVRRISKCHPFNPGGIDPVP